MENKNKIPVTPGQVLKVYIESIGAKGDGVVKIKGYTIFVKKANIGDNLKIRVLKTFEKFGFAEVLA